MPYKNGIWYPYSYFDRQTPLGQSQYDKDQKEKQDKEKELERNNDPFNW